MILLPSPVTYSYIYPPLRCPVNGETYRFCFDVICMLMHHLFPIRKSQKEIKNVLSSSRVYMLDGVEREFQSYDGGISAKRWSISFAFFVLAGPIPPQPYTFPLLKQRKRTRYTHIELPLNSLSRRIGDCYNATQLYFHVSNSSLTDKQQKRRITQTRSKQQDNIKLSCPCTCNT